jgi:hypothetical protein
MVIDTKHIKLVIRTLFTETGSNSDRTKYNDIPDVLQTHLQVVFLE